MSYDFYQRVWNPAVVEAFWEADVFKRVPGGGGWPES
jgi:hypothetical protein